MFEVSDFRLAAQMSYAKSLAAADAISIALNAIVDQNMPEANAEALKILALMHAAAVVERRDAFIRYEEERSEQLADRIDATLTGLHAVDGSA